MERELNEQFRIAAVSMSNVLYNAAQQKEFPERWRESFEAAYKEFDAARDRLRTAAPSDEGLRKALAVRNNLRDEAVVRLSNLSTMDVRSPEGFTVSWIRLSEAREIACSIGKVLASQPAKESR